jgi:predicted nucleic acid-binding protein
MSIERVVVNSSPLIALCRSGQEQLLPGLFKTVVVPNQVYEEVVAGKNDEAAKVLRSQPEWMNREKVEISLAVAAWNLGEGESAVFSFAVKVPKHRAVVDDLAARRCARVLGIKTLGTGGLLVLAKRRGLIASVNERIRKLMDSGLYLSDAVVQVLLSEAGE